MKEIFERRSIRKYTADPVSLEHEEKLLRAAMQAPSAGNEQPWEFIVVRDPETLKKMTEGHPYSTPLLGAPLGILVCGDVNKQRFNPYAYWVQDCSAAIQNLLLEAQHLGLGAVWMVRKEHPVHALESLAEITCKRHVLFLIDGLKLGMESADDRIHESVSLDARPVLYLVSGDILHIYGHVG